MTLRDLFRSIFKWGRQIVFVTVFACVAGTAFSFLYPPIYKSEGEVLVKRSALEAEDLPLSQAMPRPSMNIRQLNQADEINTIIAMLRSRDLITRVIDEMGLTIVRLDHVSDYRRYVRMAYKGAKSILSTAWNETKYFLRMGKRPLPEEIALINRTRLIERVRDALHVSQVPDSDVVRVLFACSDPVLSRDVAQVLCRLAINWHNEKRAFSSDNLAFFTEQVKAAKRKLYEAERKLSSEKSSFNTIGAEQQKSLLIQFQLESLGRLNEAVARKAALSSGIASLKEEMKFVNGVITLSRDVALNPIWETLNGRLSELQIERAKKRVKFSDDGRVLADMEKKIGEVKGLISGVEPKMERSSTTGVNQTYQLLQQTMLIKTSELAAVTAEIESIGMEIRDFEKRLRTLNDQIYRTMSLELERKSLRKSYDLYLRNAEMARVGNERLRSKMANLVIVQNASFPVNPSKPVKWLYILIATIGGFSLGIVWALVKDFNDTTYWNAEELEADLNATVLGTLPEAGGALRQRPSRS